MSTYLYYGMIRNKVALVSKLSQFPTHCPLFYHPQPSQNRAIDKNRVAGQAKEPSRKLIAEWLVEVYTNIPVGMGRNTWKKRGYEWVY